MRRRTFVRDLVGTICVFVLLLIITTGFIWGENLLEAFKSH